jgi:hypothetical protein
MLMTQAPFLFSILLVWFLVGRHRWGRRRHQACGSWRTSG